MKIAITSMYANPLHPGHIECLERSKEIADYLIVIVNNDYQAKLKRGTESFQDEAYRLRLVEALKPVDRAVLSIDTDGTVCATLEHLITELKANKDVREIIFTKGGDRFASEIPERVVLDKHSVLIKDGLGSKTHSSSSYVTRLENGTDLQTRTDTLTTTPKKVREKDTEQLEVTYTTYSKINHLLVFKITRCLQALTRIFKNTNTEVNPGQ